MVQLYSTDNYTFIGLADRAANGYYFIPGSVTQVFPFAILPMMLSTITAVQTAPGMEDYSLRMWFSTCPLDGPLFRLFDNLHPVYLTRRAVTTCIFDQNILNLATGSLTLEPMLTYFLNVQNMQAKRNAYRLILPPNIAYL